MKRIPLLILTLVLISVIYKLFFKVNRVQAETGDKVRILVGFKKITPGFIRDSVIKNTSKLEEEDLMLPDTKVITVPASNSQKLIAALTKNFWVEFAETDFEASTQYTPNDTDYLNQWGLSKIKAPGAWDITTGSENVDIAILDTGINYSHPDLSGKLSVSVNCTNTECSTYWTTDPDGHGTHTAGIAAAITDNNLGIAGVTGKSKLMSVKVLSDNGSGYYSWIINGIIWASDNGAEVINLSLGSRYYSSAMEQAVNYAWNKGVVVVAAAGNNGSNISFYPAAYSRVIAVAASDTNDNKANFSNYGSGWVDVVAPGVSIFSTYKSGYAYLSGTSMAAPFVSGVGALILSKNPNWTNTQIRQKIEQAADRNSGSGIYWNYGRINACKALDCISGPEPTVTVTPHPTATPSITPTVAAASPTPRPTLFPTLTPTPSVAPTLPVTPTPGPDALPWWCKYIPTHYTCR